MATVSITADISSEVKALLRIPDYPALVARADEWWTLLADLEPTPDAAEICRYVNLAHASLGDPDSGALWRARALSIAARVPWRNGIAVLLQPPAFQLMELERFHEARAVLEEMLRLADDHDPVPFSGVTAETVRRLYWEKRGFTYYFEDAFDEALRCYDRAITHAGDDPRGDLKVRGARALCLYLAQPERTAEALTATRAVLRGATEGGYGDVAEFADYNLRSMERGWRALKPFEIISQRQSVGQVRTGPRKATIPLMVLLDQHARSLSIEVRVLVLTSGGEVERIVQVPTDAPAREVFAKVLGLLDLERTDARGRPVDYEWQIEGSLDPLRDDRSLADQSVADGDTLLIAPVTLPVIFVSYARADVVQARLLRDGLTDAGYDVLGDWSIRPGEDWAESLSRLIRSCDVLVVLCSPDAVASEHVRNEVNLAGRRSSGAPTFVPVLLGDVDLSGGLEYWLTRSQWVDLSGVDPTAHLDLLIRGLDANRKST